jgi:hypothetical protein
MLAAMMPITRPNPPPPMGEAPAMSWTTPMMIVIHPHVRRVENAYTVPLKKCALPPAAMP